MPTLADIIEALPVIISLIVIEGLLSVDNALAIAAMANHLPGKQKLMALRLGIIGAYAFRGIALAFAAFIIDNPWLKIIGAAYLIYLMCQHFTDAADEQESQAEGGDHMPHLVKGFWATVIGIEIMDLSLSVDNVVAAVALSPKLWVVCTGVFIGILALRFVAGWCIKLIEKFPILEETAFLLIGYVGFILVFELSTHIEVHSLEKFIGIVVIVGATILYSRTPVFQKVLSPVLKVLSWPMRLVAVVIGFVITVICWPFKMIYNLFKKPATT